MHTTIVKVASKVAEHSLLIIGILTVGLAAFIHIGKRLQK